jgi:hypothetical protein
MRVGPTARFEALTCPMSTGPIAERIPVLEETHGIRGKASAGSILHIEKTLAELNSGSALRIEKS